MTSRGGKQTYTHEHRNKDRAAEHELFKGAGKDSGPLATQAVEIELGDGVILDVLLCLGRVFTLGQLWMLLLLLLVWCLLAHRAAESTASGRDTVENGNSNVDEQRREHDKGWALTFFFYMIKLC